ncbi:MAG: 1-phosphofructokinase family hexose kinase [Gammaproteobacteria bacterium]|nr:1-phosphofructokinase family hexose kinase [Gammaproteobacteria bacterium]
MSNSESMQTVAVLALNPAVDISYEIPQLLADQKVRATKTYYHPGGNGINVARSLRELEVPVRCCSVLGGKGGELFLRLLGDSLGDGHRYVEVDGETRINVTLQQKQPPSQYEVDSGGPEISDSLLDQITSCFLENTANSFAVLTGSTPPGVPESTYAELTEEISDLGGKVILDAHGKVLENGLEAKPYLLRINRYVLEMLIKQSLESIEAVAHAARNIQTKHATEFVCISLGREGAVLVDRHNSYHCPAPRVRVKSTVGSGDAMLAGMVTALLKQQEAKEMLRFGIMCGSATASYPGTCLFKRNELETMDFDVELNQLDI